VPGGRGVRRRGARRMGGEHGKHFEKGNAMRVLITGITGFAGSHLADLCLARKNVELFGIIRWRSRTENIEHIWDKVKLIECDLRDATSTRDAIEEIRPEYIFHLAAQSFVPTSWNAPTESLVTNIIGQLNVFEAVRKIKLACRIQIACSSEEYGMVYAGEIPIRETNPLRPLSPYAVSKVGQDMLGYQYYMSYKMDVVRTRGFNHTGPRRPAIFVCSDFAKQIELTPRVAFLSFSNFGSTHHPLAEKISKAVELTKAKRPELAVDGEMQADTAVVAEIVEERYPFSAVKNANVLVFPSLESANIAYKLLARLGNAKAIGPVLVGVGAPIHVLQTGDEVDSIVQMAAIAAVDAMVR